MSAPTQIVTPYLCCRRAADALDFYARAFGAKELVRYVSQAGAEMAAGGIGHAEIEIEGGRIMLSDEWPEGGVWSPQKYGGSSCSIHLSVKDVDALSAQAVAAGATLERPVEDQPYGDRSCVLRDPFGHRWFLSTPVEQVSKEELRRRMGPSYLID
jgi:PhnB protein